MLRSMANYSSMRVAITGRAAGSTEDLALLEMQIVLIEIPQRPGIVDIKKHTLRNRGLLFYLRLLVDQSILALPFGSQC